MSHRVRIGLAGQLAGQLGVARAPSFDSIQ